jgi:hypothetical protein
MTTERQGDGLDALLAAARAHRPQPPEALMARILADADAAAAEAQGRRAPRAAVAGPARGGPLRALAELLGGWPALGGLAACTALGLGLGLAQPAALSGVASGLTGAIWGGGVSLSLGLDEDLLGALDAGAASLDG